MTISSTTDSDSRGRQWFIAIGVVLVGLGLIALWNVVDATVVTTILIGWLLVIGGISHAAGALFTAARPGSRLVHVLLGVLYVLVGFGVVFDPLPGAIALSILLGALLVVDGILRIGGVVLDPHHAAGWTAALGGIDTLLGLWLWTGIPFSGVPIGFFVGIQLLVAGIAWLVAGFMGSAGPELPAKA